ncbi:2Fe-2S iron-sulfur cluster binding domain containing protein [Trypanosoma grayi]|uniref:2Fe-2S iron-sulfur cluster binding domain containing protein n=1 Tax=Trypanosoma grayi TaxID=71804 RepID=UPI0004F45838|nr:2Fe-2S iron-sulfur cluster binding domain containing protein [Trypanosoma grayi]KEG08121.1 2Fe-2S iron-sulfur cluster binding domain containing protein [Trypanosoma grayi]
MSEQEPLKEISGKCPTPGELGHSGWNVLHSAAAVYPYKPTPLQQEAFRSFIHGWSHVYACTHCAYHMRRYLERNPPVVTDKLALNRYMCEFHNTVNKSVGKRVYDCDPMIVLRRWHPKYPDMEDQPTVEEQIEAQKKLDQFEAQKELLGTQQQHQPRRETHIPLTKGDDGGVGGGSNSSTSLQRPSERWRVESADVKSNVGTFAAGWGSFGQQKQQQQRKDEAVAPPRQEESSNKGWWLFGGNSTRGDNSSSRNDGAAVGGAARAAGTGGKVADDEADVLSIMKRLKACMVYCPENDKNAPST